MAFPVSICRRRNRNHTDHCGAAGTNDRLSALNANSISYDADGNVTRKTKSGVYDRNYFWSAESQLDSTFDGSSFKGYDYNALGKPVRIWVGTGAGRHVDRYLLWDGENLLAELDASNQRIADYSFFPGTVDLPFAVTMGATYPATEQFHETDELGT